MNPCVCVCVCVCVCRRGVTGGGRAGRQLRKAGGAGGAGGGDDMQSDDVEGEGSEEAPEDSGVGDKKLGRGELCTHTDRHVNTHAHAHISQCLRDSQQGAYLSRKQKRERYSSLCVMCVSVCA